MARRWRLVVCGLTVGALAACTSASPGAVGTPPASAPVSAPPVSGSASAAGFAPGAASIGDPLFPADGNGGYDVTHYDVTISYNPSTTVLTGRDVVTAAATQGLSRFDAVNFISHGISKRAGMSEPRGVRGVDHVGALGGVRDAKGDPQIGVPGGSEGLGTLAQGYTEQSNVDVVAEFVNLIQSQRAYEANSRVVKAADEMYQQVNQLTQ